MMITILFIQRKGVAGDELEHPEKPLADLLAEAQVYCQYQLTPSFETKLPSDVLLSLHGKDKAVARFESVRRDSQSTKGGIRRFVLQTRSKKPSIISCRVSRVARTSVGSIPGWMAYDYRGAIGLAKEKRTLSIEEKRVSLKGVEKSAIVFQTKGEGIIYSDYLIALPEEPPVHLEVDAGLLRNASLMVPKGWGSSYTVEVNGAKIAVDWTQSAGWHHHTVDLSEHAGKTILLTLARYQKPLVMEGAWWAWKEVLAKTQVMDERWHHGAVTYDMKNYKIYTDGVLEKQRPVDKKPDENNLPLQIGSGGGGPFNGIIDEVAIFNVALTEDSIKSIMTKGLEKIVISDVSPSGNLSTTWGQIKSSCQ